MRGCMLLNVQGKNLLQKSLQFLSMMLSHTMLTGAESRLKHLHPQELQSMQSATCSTAESSCACTCQNRASGRSSRPGLWGLRMSKGQKFELYVFAMGS